MQIFYFGGYQADSGDTTMWATTVERKVKGVRAYGFPYPLQTTSSSPLMNWNLSPTVASMVTDGDIIVGHSSGCAISNDVAQSSLLRGVKFKLIALDGFCPSPSLLKLPDTEVWGAECGGVKSRNYESLKAKAGAKFKVYEAAVIKAWPLHFSMVNLNVSDDWARITDGYHKIDANLEVLGLEVTTEMA